MSLLTAKQRRMSPQAQVQSLVRIGRRALANADHLDNLLVTYYARPEATEQERIDTRRTIVEKRARAEAAVDEIVAIAESSGDLDLRRKARAARAVRY